MLAGVTQYFPKFAHTAAIEVQPLHGRSANRRKSDDEQCVIAPGKVHLPFVLPRVKEGDQFAGERVVGHGRRELMPLQPAQANASFCRSLKPPADFGDMCSTENGAGEQLLGQRQYSQRPFAASST